MRFALKRNICIHPILNYLSLFFMIHCWFFKFCKLPSRTIIEVIAFPVVLKSFTISDTYYITFCYNLARSEWTALNKINTHANWRQIKSHLVCGHNSGLNGSPSSWDDDIVAAYSPNHSRSPNEWHCRSWRALTWAH